MWCLHNSSIYAKLSTWLGRNSKIGSHHVTSIVTYIWGTLPRWASGPTFPGLRIASDFSEPANLTGVLKDFVRKYIKCCYDGINVSHWLLWQLRSFSISLYLILWWLFFSFINLVSLLDFLQGTATVDFFLCICQGQCLIWSRFYKELK